MKEKIEQLKIEIEFACLHPQAPSGEIRRKKRELARLKGMQ